MTGVDCQGGVYLAKLLLQKSYILHCVKHCSFLFKMARIDRLIETSVFNVKRLAEFGWQYTVDLEQGLARTYKWFLKTDLLYAVD